MKNKVIKIIFIASFLPYVLLLICGIMVAFSGSTIMHNFEGLVMYIFFLFYIFFPFSFPIILACLIFQICYILRKTVKPFKNIQPKKYTKICCIVGCLLIAGLFVYYHLFSIKKIIEKANAKQMINNAEEKIGFDKSHILVGGIFNMPEYRYNHVLIDYDKIEIGMLLNASLEEFWKVKLKKTSLDSLEYQHIVNDYFMQADIPLNSPGKRLISFYEEESLMHRTIAFLLIYEDGTIYFADNIKEKDTGFTRYTGLQWSEFFVGENKKFNE